MTVDPRTPPVEPPPGCRQPLLWRAARALWLAHRPDEAGFCAEAGCRTRFALHPCDTADLAEEGLDTAAASAAEAPWIAEVRDLVDAGQLDPVDAMAELLWRHHRHREVRQR